MFSGRNPLSAPAAVVEDAVETVESVASGNVSPGNLAGAAVNLAADVYVRAPIAVATAGVELVGEVLGGGQTQPTTVYTEENVASRPTATRTVYTEEHVTRPTTVYTQEEVVVTRR